MVKKREKEVIKEISNNKKRTKIAFISDLTIGTKLYNPDVFSGVSTVLSSCDMLSNVVICGGLLARVPQYHNVKNAHFLDLLDSDLESKYGIRVAKKVKRIHDFKLGIETEEAEQNNKKIGINSLEDLIEVVQNEVRKIKLDQKVKFHYIFGEEDYENVADLLQTKIQEVIRTRDERIKGLDEQLKRAETTRQNKYEEIKLKEEELRDLSEKTQVDKNQYINGLEDQLKKLNGELEQLNVAYRSYEKHLTSLDREKNILTKTIRRFTKTWNISREEYVNPEKEGVKNRALTEYKEVIFPMFKGKSLEIISHLEELLLIDGLKMNLSHNRNAIRSNEVLISAIMKRVEEAKIKNRRNEKVPDLDIEAHHAGGFKLYAQRKGHENDAPIYFIQLPPLQDPQAVREARNNWIRTWDTKRFEYPFASGLVLFSKREDKVIEVEFYSSDLLKEIARGKKFTDKDKLKIEVLSDVHIGAPNEKGFVSNYEMIDAIIKYQKASERLPDIVVVNGDIINGQHLDQIVHEYVRDVPSKIEEKKQKLIDAKLTKQEKFTLLKEIEREEKYGGAITDVSKQKEELRLRLYPYWEDVLSTGGEIIFVSGQHFNKSMKYREDEATELANMVNMKYKDVIHVFSGKEFGSGQKNIKGLEIYAMHSPKRKQDEVTSLISHLSKINRKVNLAIGGNYHQPGIGYADETFFVAAPGLQTWVKYVDEIGKQGGLRGIINVYINPEIHGYAKFELVFEETLKEILNSEQPLKTPQQS